MSSVTQRRESHTLAILASRSWSPKKGEVCSGASELESILLTRALLQCQTSKICRSETMAYPVYFRSQTSKFCCSACKICCSDQQLLRSIHGKVVMNTGTSWNRCIPKTFLIREIPTVALGFRFGLGLVLWFAGGSYSFLLCSVLPCARAKAGAPLVVEEFLWQP